MIFEDLKKRSMDLGAIIAFLELEIDNDKKRISNQEGNKSFWGTVFFGIYESRIPIAEECKEKLTIVKAVIEKFDSDSFQEAKIGDYKPRKLTSHLDILKYRTEITKTKKAIEPLLFISKAKGDIERQKKCEECLDHLKHVYTALAKIKN